MTLEHDPQRSAADDTDKAADLLLVRYVLLSFGIAAVEWLMNPEILLRIFPSLKQTQTTILDFFLPLQLNLLPLIWLIVVIKGLRRCGLPGLVLLIPAWWALHWWLFMAFLIVSCLSGRECI